MKISGDDQVEQRLARRWYELMNEHAERVYGAVAVPAHELAPDDREVLDQLRYQRAMEQMQAELTADEWARFTDWHSRLHRQGRDATGTSIETEPRWLRRYRHATDRLESGEPIEVLLEDGAAGIVARVAGWHSSAPMPTDDEAIAALFDEIAFHHRTTELDVDRFTFRRINPLDRRRRL